MWTKAADEEEDDLRMLATGRRSRSTEKTVETKGKLVATEVQPRMVATP